MENIININNKKSNIINLDSNIKTIINIEDNTNNNIVVFGKDFDNELIFNIGKDVELIINNFMVNSINKVYINFNEENSNVNYINTTLNSIKNHGIIKAEHFKSNTTSHLLIHGLNKDNELFYDVVGKIHKDAYSCDTDQDSKIINLSEEYPVGTTPILLIDNYDVSADHSGYIGSFDDDVLFYLKSRGISYDDSYKLLLEAFLLGILEIDEKTYNKFLNIVNKFMEV